MTVRSLRCAIFLATLMALAPAATAAPASAKVLEHRATGLTVKAPADFRARFDRASRTYTVASRRRDVAFTYRLVRTRRPARIAGRILASRAASEPVRQRGGAHAFRARFESGRVMRVRGARPGLLSVVRFDPARWDGPARPLLGRIRASLRGGLTARLSAARRRWAPKPEHEVAAPRSSGTTLIRSDFEGGDFTGWYLQSLRHRATIVGNGAFDSSHAARFEVHEGDAEPDTGSERSEISLSGPDFGEGDDLYVRDVLRVPRGSAIEDSWLIVNQLHESDWGGSPGIAVFLGEGPSIEIGSGDGNREFLGRTPIEFDRWHDLVYRVNLSRDPGVGFVEVWLDGVQLTLANGQTRIYGQTIQAARAYLKAGIYRGSSNDGTTVVEHDDITVATSFEAATGR